MNSAKYKSIINILILLQFLLYIGMALIGPVKQISDSAAYLKILNELYQGDGYYPSYRMIFDNYINNPGAVNIYEFIWKLYKTDNIRVLFIANAFFISIGNYLIYKSLLLIKIHPSRNIFFYILSTLYLSNFGLISSIASEVPAYFLMCLLIYITFRHKVILMTRISLFYLILFGLLSAFFDYIRPVGVLCCLSAILSFFLFRKKLMLNLSYCLTYILIIMCTYSIGKLSISQLSGSLSSMSINGSIALGYNMLMGNGTDADGSWIGGVYNEGGKGYFNQIKKTTAVEKDKRWIKQSIDSIICNPRFFFYLGCRKVLLTVSYDVLALERVLLTKDIQIYFLRDIGNWKNFGLINYFIIIINNIVYWFLLIGFLLFSYHLIRSKKFNKLTFNFYLFLLFVLLYLSIIFIVLGGSRYHHILMPIFFLFTACNYSKLHFKTIHGQV